MAPDVVENAWTYVDANDNVFELVAVDSDGNEYWEKKKRRGTSSACKLILLVILGILAIMGLSGLWTMAVWMTGGNYASSVETAITHEVGFVVSDAKHGSESVAFASSF